MPTVDSSDELNLTETFKDKKSKVKKEKPAAVKTRKGKKESCFGIDFLRKINPKSLNRMSFQQMM